MKKLCILLICMLSILCYEVSALETMEITLQVKNVESGGLFDVYVYSDRADLLEGTTLEVSYDDTMLEYREVDSNKFLVEGYEDEENLKVIMASQSITEEEKDECIATLKFKAIKDGSSDISVSCQELIDSELDDIKVVAKGITVNVDDGNVDISRKSSSNSDSKSSKAQVQIVRSEDKSSVENSGGISGILKYIFPEYSSKKIAGNILIYAVALGGVAIFATGIVQYCKSRKKSKKTENKVD
ncbi:MAG: hypothetical protein IKB73_03505 [Ruminococcus sp.]|nr:hypothetical protein [Ruminococcus sp.]